MSTVIKAANSRTQQAAPLTGYPVADVQHIAFNLNDMSSQADRYLDQVRAQAAKLLQEAAKQAAEIRKQAEHDGKQAAIKAVERIMDEKLAKQLQTLLPALQQTGKELAQAKQAWLNHWEQSAVRVATAIAARVIRREVKAEPQITVDLIKEALELAAGSGQIALHLNPADAQTLGDQVQQLTTALGTAGTVQLIPDKQITPGGCRVETRFGVIDQQFEAQLKRIEEELV